METFNPTLYGGGRFPPPPQVLGSGGFQIDPRGSKVWHNSYFIVTMEVQNLQNLKGVPKKIWSMFFEAGVKNQNLKLEPISLRFCMGQQGPNRNFFCFPDHIDLGPYSKDMAVLKQKMPIFWKRSPTKKNVTAQKSLRICFYPYIGGQKKFLFFFEKNFFWNTL